LRQVETIIRDAANLTRELLGLARGGKYEVKATNINRLINMSADLFGRTKKEIRIYLSLQKDLWTVEVDRSQIEQVLLNLFVNASQAMPKGGDLHVETQNVNLDSYYTQLYSISPGRFIRISVTDTGVGMDGETLKRIFDPFFTTKEMGKGTGLGLASAYGIIRNHSGIINVYSEKERGTTFNIYLPISDKAIPEEIHLPDEIMTGTETILLVDDEETILRIGEEILERLGYQVLTAKSGDEAIHIYEQYHEQIALVILDMIMPDISGGDIFDRLKIIDHRVTVLLSSGYSLNGQAKKIMDRGCRGFIQKPYSASDLSRKLRAILDA
jgi:two-component system cell cycle sensor histidine kinase/response regulator CckA